MAVFASPPFTITPAIDALVREIVVATLSFQEAANDQTQAHHSCLRKIQASLAMEHVTCDVDEVADILSGRRVAAWPQEIRAVRNAFAAHELLPYLLPDVMEDLLVAHQAMMRDLIDDAGRLRRAGSGLARGGRMLFLAPPAHYIPFLVSDLLQWLREARVHPLIAGCVFHCELEFMHPFSDGNGRVGRLWQSLIHSRWSRQFATLPWEIQLLQCQETFYQILADCEREGSSTLGVEFLLEMVLRSLREEMDSSRRSEISLSLRILS